MTKKIEIFVDLSQAGLDLGPEELEAYSLALSEELKDELAEDASLVRAFEVPEATSKPGEAGFQPGLLKVVNPKDLKSFLDSLGKRIYGSTLKITYGDITLEYRDSQQLEEQLQALERISRIQVRVVKNETGKG